MRTLKISHEDIALIEAALQYVYNRKLDHIKQSINIINAQEKVEILNSANRYLDVFDQLQNGEFDV